MDREEYKRFYKYLMKNEVIPEPYDEESFDEYLFDDYESEQCDIHVVMWRWYACTFGSKLPFEEHNFTDFDEMKRFSARHSKIYKTDTNEYVSGYDKINAT